MKITQNLPINMDAIQYNKSEAEASDFQKTLEAAKADQDAKKLKSACQQFEAVFLNMILKNMRTTGISEGGFIEKSHAREIFEGMLDEKLSQEMSKGQGVGLAQQLFKQLSKNSGIQNNK